MGQVSTREQVRWLDLIGLTTVLEGAGEVVSDGREMWLVKMTGWVQGFGDMGLDWLDWLLVFEGDGGWSDEWREENVTGEHDWMSTREQVTWMTTLTGLTKGFLKVMEAEDNEWREEKCDWWIWLDEYKGTDDMGLGWLDWLLVFESDGRWSDEWRENNLTGESD